MEKRENENKETESMTQQIWDKMTNTARVHYLSQEFAMSLREAKEVVCDKLSDLPDDIKGYMEC